MWVKKTIQNHSCKEDYAWNPSTCASECDKYCEIGEYLKDCICMKNLVGGLVIICDEIIDMQPSKFTSTVGNCQGFCWGKQCFYSNYLGKNMAEVINS